MDPYAGINFGATAEGGASSGIWNFLDLGMGPWGGLAAWGGAGLLYHHLQKPGGVASMLRGTMKSARAGPGLNRLINRYGTLPFTHLTPKQIVPTPTAIERRMGGAATRRWINLSDDVGSAAKMGGKGTRGMFHNIVEMNRKRGTTLIQRYGAKPAARIAAGHVLGRAFTFMNVVSMLALGAELGRSVTQSIVDWQPSQAKPVELDFGTGQVDESFQARTMRQQSLAAIHNSQLTVRAALGNEAVHLHQ